MSEQTSTAEPAFPEAKLNLIPAKSPQIGRVVSNDLCMKGKSSSFVRHLVVDVEGTDLEGNFLVGQSFGVISPGVDEQGKPHKVRLFSIACPSWGEDGQGKHVSTTPKRVIDEFQPQRPTDDGKDHSLFLGVCSNYLNNLRPGAEIMVTGPAGKRFLLPVNTQDHDFVLIAAGTGIAPFRGMALELLENPAGPCPSRVHLLMGSPYTTDLLYDDLFRRMADEHDNFHYHTAISREPRGGRERGIYVHHLIEEKLDEFGDLLAGPRTLVYICGLLGMENGFYQVLLRHGLESGYITVSDELRAIDPSTWDSKLLRRHVKTTARCMVEVY